MKKQGTFFRDHADTMAIIGVNLAGFAILISLWLSNMSTINAANSRIDTLYVMFYDLLKDGRK
jgi:hypothetical protein